MNKLQEDEIDLLRLFIILWNGKWQITIFVALAVILGSGFILTKDPVYHSRIVYKTNVIPPYYHESNKKFIDFQKLFYSKNSFENWKKVNPKSPIIFQNFSLTKVVEGFVFQNEEEDRQAYFITQENPKKTFILINSKNLFIVDAYFKYAQYINNLISQKYKFEAKNIFESKTKNISKNDETESASDMKVSLFLIQIARGDKVFLVNRPTEPIKVSPRKYFIIMSSILLGGLFGVFFVVVNHIYQRKS
jgi:LPS O-antigen subunit length determinant protein (WzzB/FepE family)